MQLTDFNFNLPQELIAQYPCKDRTGCRLLALDGNTGETQDLKFYQVIDFLKPGDLLVFNDTKVIPARIFGNKETGAKVEILVERIYTKDRILAHTRASRSPKIGSVIIVGEYRFEVVDRQDDLFVLSLKDTDESVFDVLDRIGHVPLPPYINRPDDSSDKDDYQTVYGRIPGAVAAPTAGLHFDEALIERIRDKGVKTAFVTLHVGAGTFQPVKESRIEDHKMHAEFVHVPEEVTELIRETKRNGGKVVAVGTTSIRSLESCAQEYGSVENMHEYNKDTSIFIYPGYQYKVVDALITNFHLPQSTLIMLVSAFAGYEHTMQAYEHAVAEKYRFFSYGDAMYITRKTN
ncbi:MAG: tRNA preQ1(34) S-adenosylmethionine ribosyltransferase-isomerase QueA [Succinivibrionaceae bacterium]|nr:tRNA preQ1(34) S-adenosylmethionine ribosyltransferase-isomerase QueA [Succinivibrionaceae bacterium]